MAFAPTIPVPSALPPALAGAAMLADRVEGLLTRFCDSHPDENPELLIRAARAIWNLTAVRKTIYLLTNPGADRRHRRGKPDATMTYIQHRVSELHDWVAEYQRLVRALKRNPELLTQTPVSPPIEAPKSPTPHVVPPSGGILDSSSSSLGTPVSAPAPSIFPSPSAPSAPPLPLRDQESTPEKLPTPLPTHMNSTPPLRNPLGTALATARETVAIATEANIPFDRTNFFPTEIDPAACIADAQARQLNSSSMSSSSCSSSSLVPSCLGGEKITFRNRKVTLTGKSMPPNDLPQLPKLASPLNPRKSKQSPNPCPLPNPKVPSRSDFFALINKITKQRPPSSAPPPPSPFDTPGILSESILKNLKPGLRLPNSQPPPGHRRPPT